MIVLNFEIHCLRCGYAIQGQREKNEHKKHFKCPKCTGQFSITFEHPSREKLQDAFIEGELLPDLFPPWR